MLFPVLLIKTSFPSVITVLYPFKRTIHLYCFAKSLEHSILFFSTYEISFPISLAISPGCGVRITLSLTEHKHFLFLLSKFIPPASIIIDEGLSIIISSKSFIDSSSSLIPGPKATASALLSKYLTFSLSSKVANIPSTKLPLSSFLPSLDVINVVSPAPLRIHDSVANLAAPRHPMLPATKTALP